jgi:hypothetical protein
MIVALDALNRPVDHLCAASAGGNMNLLPGVAVFAFHCYYDIAVVGHRWVSVWILPRTIAGLPGFTYCQKRARLIVSHRRRLHHRGGRLQLKQSAGAIGQVPLRLTASFSEPPGFTQNARQRAS